MRQHRLEELDPEKLEGHRAELRLKTVAGIVSLLPPLRCSIVVYSRLILTPLVIGTLQKVSALRRGAILILLRQRNAVAP